MIMSDARGAYKFETYMLRDEDCEYIRKCVKPGNRRKKQIFIPIIRNADNREIHYDNVEFPEKHKDLQNYVYAGNISQYKILPIDYAGPSSIKEYNALPKDKRICEAEYIFFLVPLRPLFLISLNPGWGQITADEFSSSSMQFAKYTLTDRDCEYIWSCVKPPKFRKNFMAVPILRTRENENTHFNGVIFPPEYKELEKFVWLSRIEQFTFGRFWPNNAEIWGGEQLCFFVLSRPLCISWINDGSIIPGYTTFLEFPIADALTHSQDYQK